MHTSQHFEVQKNNLHKTRHTSEPVGELGPGQVRLKVDHFALTANNITYAAFGDMMQYWKFFPTEDGWGRVPVWGFADVEASNVEDINVGERFYGYYPMSTHLVVQPVKLSPYGFFDGSPHRQGLAEVYNSYMRTTQDTVYTPDTEAQQMLYRPLFTTSFLIDDMLASDGYHGADQLILSSASSKTALALAHLAKSRGGVSIAGLTSSGNANFVSGLGVYDHVITYDQIAEKLASRPSAYVDFAGAPAISGGVHHRLKDDLKFSLIVGATDWDAERAPPSEPLPGPEPQFFFAPDIGKARVQEWGLEGYTQKVNESMLTFYTAAKDWIKPVSCSGVSSIERCYLDALDGQIPPNEGRIVSL